MKIKTKLTLGVGLLFIMIVILSLVATLYINALKNDTNNILVDNYNTIEYSRSMMLALDENILEKETLARFESSLFKQQHNISEVGEKESTDLLAKHFALLKANPTDTTKMLHQLIRKDIADIMRMNMEAIERKSNLAKQTATSATIWIAITGTLCFLIAFTLLVNLPNNIANPIKELTESIKQIAQKNYDRRVNFEDHDEFGELATSFNTMAEKLEEYNNSTLSKLLFEKKRIETLINNMHDPVIGLDAAKNILFVNNEALKILGLRPEELIGKPVQDVAMSNDLIRNLIQELIINPVATTKEQSAPIKIFADQKESYFEKELVHIMITPTGEKENVLIGYVIILKNITPFKELDFAKTNFIATVSHELKTPIASIKMSLKLLENKEVGTINEEQKHLIESIKDDSNRLLKITGELLNMSQVETGNIQLNIQQSSADEILDYALEAVKIPAEQKHIHVQIDKEGQLPLVMADSEKTAWVLINFLTNAIRYSSEQSKIFIDIKNENNYIIFSVKDEGRGIDGRYRDKIFDRYFQVPDSHKSGTGLGLAISKEFIQAQGGEIGVESEIGMGSRFYFKLKAVS